MEAASQPAGNAPRRGRRVFRFVPLVVSVGLLVAIAWGFDGWHLLAAADVPVLLLALLASLTLNTTVGAFKWWRVARLSGIPATFEAMWTLWNGLAPIAAVTPFQSGHALYVVGLRNDQHIPWFQALECVVYDKGLSLVATFALIAVGQLVLPASHPLSHPLILAGAAAVVLAFFADRLLFRLLGRVHAFRRHSTLLHDPVSLRHKFWLLPLAMLYQSSDTITMVLACHALGLDVPLGLLLGAFPLILLLTYVPVSVSGFGVRESLIVFFLAGSLSQDEALSAGLLVAVVEYVAPALFGVLVLPRVLPVLWRLRGPADAATAPDGAGCADHEK